MVPLPFSRARSTCYSDRLHDFSVTIPSMSTASFLALPIECFPLTYGLSGFMSRINRHTLTVGAF